MKLHEWTLLYVRYKDAFKKEILDVKDERDVLTFFYKKHILTVHALEKLSIPPIQGKTLITTLQKKENINFLIENWKTFTKHDDLTIIFANPGRHEKWAIKPALHNKIAEDIIAGIWSLAEGTTYV